MHVFTDNGPQIHAWQGYYVRLAFIVAFELDDDAIDQGLAENDSGS
jgi:hypothetical protein